MTSDWIPPRAVQDRVYDLDCAIFGAMLPHRAHVLRPALTGEFPPLYDFVLVKQLARKPRAFARTPLAAAPADPTEAGLSRLWEDITPPEYRAQTVDFAARVMSGAIKPRRRR